MTSLAQLLADADRIADGIEIDVPDTWHQGRTAFGGFSSALCLAVAQQVGGPVLPALRSGQLAMMAPVAGRVRATARIERQGRNATWISARIDDEKGLAFSANFVFMRAIASSLSVNDRAPPSGLTAPERSQLTPYPSGTPAFILNHLDICEAFPDDGQKPLPDIWRWVRLRDREELDPLVELLLIGDALPPAVLALGSGMIPLSTMHWQVSILSERPTTKDGWWLLRSVSDYAENGCSSQVESIWNMDGAAMMASMQSIALFA